MLTKSTYITLIIFGTILIKIIVNWAGKYQLKPNEITLFSVQIVLVLLTFLITGMKNIDIDSNTLTILISYSLGLMSVVIWKFMETRFPLYGNDVTLQMYYIMFAVLTIITLICSLYSVATTSANNLFSFIIQVITVIILYILLISSRRSSWSIQNGLKTPIQNGEDCTPPSTQPTNEEDCKTSPFGCCPHQPERIKRSDPFGTNCKVYQKQEINTNYGIMLWILTTFFYNGQNDKNNNNGSSSLPINTVSLQFFLIGAFISYSSIYKTEFPLRTTLYNLYPLK